MKKRSMKKKNVGSSATFVKSRNLSVKEGAAAAVMDGAGHSYITPFAIALNANNLQIGFLSSFIGLMGPLSQLYGSKLMEKYDRKTIVVKSVFIQSLLWLPVIILAFLYYFNIWRGLIPILLIIIYSIVKIAGGFPFPAWFSWMGDLVPQNIRGKFFSKRNRIKGIVTLIAFLSGALLLDFFKTKGFVLLGFAILFFVAMIARLISAKLLAKKHSIKLKLKKGYYFSIWQFMKIMPKNNFGRFVIFVSLINFAVAIAGPFFAVYILRYLGFSYLWFMLINASSTVFAFFILPFWGKFSDKYGNLKTLRISSFLIPFVPILWIFSASKIYLLLVPGLLGGIAWSAFQLASRNFIYDAVSKQRRALCITYYDIFIGIGIFVGAALGGLIATFAKISFMNIYLFIFLISGLLRFVFLLYILPTIKEVRKTKSPDILFKGFGFMENLEDQVVWYKDAYWKNNPKNIYYNLPKK